MDSRGPCENIDDPPVPGMAEHLERFLGEPEQVFLSISKHQNWPNNYFLYAVSLLIQCRSSNRAKVPPRRIFQTSLCFNEGANVSSLPQHYPGGKGSGMQVMNINRKPDWFIAANCIQPCILQSDVW